MRALSLIPPICVIEVLYLYLSLQELESRYGAVLQMYGEKAEEAEELKMDLQDIKTMYKQQVCCILDVRLGSNKPINNHDNPSL